MRTKDVQISEAVVACLHDWIEIAGIAAVDSGPRRVGGGDEQREQRKILESAVTH
jgi:hypothetical protein